MKEIIQYAHCTKFTPGQLDRALYSAYELRECEVDIRAVYTEEGESEWLVIHNGKPLSASGSLRDVQAIAAYELMCKSRDKAYHAFSSVNTCKCGAYLVPPSEMCGECSLNYLSI